MYNNDFEPEQEAEALQEYSPSKKNIKRKATKDKQEKPRVSKIKLAMVIVGLLLVLSGVGYVLDQYNKWSNEWALTFRLPVQNFIVIEPVQNQEKLK